MRISRRIWILVAVLAVLVYPAYYLISPLFITTQINEPLPASPLTLLSRGSFQNGAPGHTATGTAILYKTESGSYLIRLEEDFQVTNGPDLNVYLSKSQDPGQGFIDLGNLKGSLGSQNYNIPSNVDPEQYSYVLVWCVSFSVLFGYAVLS